VRKHGGFFYACSPDARYARMMVRPRHVRRALCATTHTAPCAQGARYHRTAYVAHCARQPTPRRAQNAHATTAPCTSRIVRDNPYRPVRRRRTLPPHRVRRALCATTHTAPCAQGARYVRMMVRPRRVRRASCATIHTEPCAQGARYHRTVYVVHCVRPSTPARAPKAHATAL